MCDPAVNACHRPRREVKRAKESVDAGLGRCDHLCVCAWAAARRPFAGGAERSDGWQEVRREIVSESDEGLLGWDHDTDRKEAAMTRETDRLCVLAGRPQKRRARSI